jgi:hypothetical protein
MQSERVKGIKETRGHVIEQGSRLDSCAERKVHDVRLQRLKQTLVRQQRSKQQFGRESEAKERNDQSRYWLDES